MLYLSEIRKSPDGVAIDEQLDLAAALKERNPEIINIQNVIVKGQVSYDDGLYLLNYQLSYLITLPSSRSMRPVTVNEDVFVTEVFIERKDAAQKRELVEEELVLILEGDQLDLVESVSDNVLLNIPSKILTQDERDNDVMPSGKDWTVLTEAQYEALQKEEKKASNPFAKLNNLFDKEE